MKRIFGAAFLSTLCLAARAEVQTGHWHDPTRPGVGISIHREGDTIFATVLDYDETGRPTWLYASEVKFTGVHLDPGGNIWKGPLYRGLGSPMRTPGSRQFSAVQVGTISMWQWGSNLTVNMDIHASNCPPPCQ